MSSFACSCITYLCRLKAEGSLTPRGGAGARAEEWGIEGNMKGGGKVNIKETEKWVGAGGVVWWEGGGVAREVETPGKRSSTELGREVRSGKWDEFRYWNGKSDRTKNQKGVKISNLETINRQHWFEKSEDTTCPTMSDEQTVARTIAS
jgi:hypothetical protein